MLALIAYPVAYEYGWPLVFVGFAAMMVLLVIPTAIWALRNETVAVVTDFDALGFDERQKLITLKARAVAGRVAAYSTVALAFILIGLQTFGAQVGAHWTIKYTEQDMITAWAAGLSMSMVIYVIVRFIAGLRYARKD